MYVLLYLPQGFVFMIRKQMFGQVNRQMNIASSPNITGPYTTAVTPFSPFGVNLTDFGLFEDDDGVPNRP